MNRLLRAVLFLIVFTAASCNDKSSKGAILPKEKLQAVLWDMLQADAFTNNFIKKDSSKNELYEVAALQKKIFELHKITRQDFTASYDHYSKQPEVMKVMFDSMSAKAERDRNKIMTERYGGMKMDVK
jgi:hypothetical protein